MIGVLRGFVYLDYEYFPPQAIHSTENMFSLVFFTFLEGINIFLVNSIKV